MFKKVKKWVKKTVSRVYRSALKVIVKAVTPIAKIVNKIAVMANNVLDWLEEKGLMPKLFIQSLRGAFAAIYISQMFLVLIAMKLASNVGVLGDMQFMLAISISLLGAVDILMSALDNWLVQVIMLVLSVMYAIPMLIISIVAGVVIYLVVRLAERVIDKHMDDFVREGAPDFSNGNIPTEAELVAYQRKLQAFLDSLSSSPYSILEMEQGLNDGITELDVAITEVRAYEAHVKARDDRIQWLDETRENDLSERASRIQQMIRDTDLSLSVRIFHRLIAQRRYVCNG